MIELIIFVVIVLAILKALGIIGLSKECAHCHQKVKKAKCFGMTTNKEFFLCKDCYSKVPGFFYEFASSNWTYENYKEYREWEESTRDIRDKFNPSLTYGDSPSLLIDPENGLFAIKEFMSKQSPVFRFQDLKECELNIELMPYSEMVAKASGSAMGSIYFYFVAAVPGFTNKYVLNGNVNFECTVDNITGNITGINPPEELRPLLEEVTSEKYPFNNIGGNEVSYQAPSELQNALALFMFDDLSAVTEEKLKKQRNALIKAFHPDNNETNEEYSQKINAAYDVLAKNIKTA